MKLARKWEVGAVGERIRKDLLDFYRYIRCGVPKRVQSQSQCQGVCEKTLCQLDLESWHG